MNCPGTLVYKGETLICQKDRGHNKYHRDQFGLPFGPWASHDDTPVSERPLETTIDIYKHCPYQPDERR